MNAPRRSIVLLFALLTAASLAATAGALSLPIASADEGVDTAFQQNTSNASVDTRTTSTNASVIVENQTRDGRSVFVESVTVPDGGFIVLRESGANGSVVGVSLPLDPGTHEGKITLRGVPGGDLNRTRLGTNTTLVAALHRDSDADGRFEGRLTSGTDGPYTANGTPVRDRAHIVVPEDERPTTATVTLANRTTRGTNVTVGAVTLPDGGYVGIHRGGYNGSNATESLVGATGYLEAGTYENVTVPIGAGIPGRNVSALTDSGRLSAVTYADTDGDRAFQYVPSGGVEDQPYLVDGDAVAGSAVVTVERPETPTPTITPTTTRTPTETSAPTPTITPTTTTDSGAAARDRTTVYGGENKAREGILDNPLFPLLVVVLAVFAVLAAVGR